MALNLIKKPLERIKNLDHSSTSASSESASVDGEEANGPVKNNGMPKGRGSKEIAEERRKRSESRKRKSAQRKDWDATAKRIDPKFMEVGQDEGAMLYKPLSMNMSKRRGDSERFLFKNLDMTSRESFVVVLEPPALDSCERHH
jgi:hypothetical protein